MSYATAFVVGLACIGGLAQAQPYYVGKKIDLFIGFPAGGGYDLYARIVARYMPKYIEGTPLIIPRQMSGAGSFIAANYAANVAPQDGTALFTAIQTMPLNQLIGDPAVKFDVQKLRWIGSPVADVNVLMTWASSGILTLTDAKSKESWIGASGPAPNTSGLYPKLANELLGTRFKILTAFQGSADIDLAMERGEISGRGSNAWSTIKATKPEWLTEKTVRILFQVGLNRAVDLPDVPLFHELPEKQAHKDLLKLLSSSTTVGRPLFMPPNTSEDRVEELRAAFDKAMKDFDFLAEAKKLKLDIDPVSGRDLEKIMDEILTTPEEVKAAAITLFQ